MSQMLIAKIIFLVCNWALIALFLYLIVFRKVLSQKIVTAHTQVNAARRNYCLNVSPQINKLHEKNEKIKMLLKINPYSPNELLSSSRLVAEEFLSSLNPFQKVVLGFGFVKGLQKLVK